MKHLKGSAYRNQYLLLNLKKNDANEIHEHQFSTNATFLYPYTKKLHTCTSIFTKAYCSLIIAKYLWNIGITFPGQSRGIRISVSYLPTASVYLLGQLYCRDQLMECWTSSVLWIKDNPILSWPNAQVLFVIITFCKDCTKSKCLTNYANTTTFVFWWDGSM